MGCRIPLEINMRRRIPIAPDRWFCAPTCHVVRIRFYDTIGKVDQPIVDGRVQRAPEIGNEIRKCSTTPVRRRNQSVVDQTLVRDDA